VINLFVIFRSELSGSSSWITNLLMCNSVMPIPLATRPMAWVCGCPLFGNAGSKTALVNGCLSVVNNV